MSRSRDAVPDEALPSHVAESMAARSRRWFGRWMFERTSTAAQSESAARQPAAPPADELDRTSAEEAQDELLPAAPNSTDNNTGLTRRNSRFLRHASRHGTWPRGSTRPAAPATVSEVEMGEAPGSDSQAPSNVAPGARRLGPTRHFSSWRRHRRRRQAPDTTEVDVGVPDEGDR